MGPYASTIEHEPLGQEILQNDPAELPDPPVNEQVGFWEDMQWQCEKGEEFYGGFYEMPFHCQQNVLQNGSGFLGDLLRKEESPKKITNKKGHLKSSGLLKLNSHSSKFKKNVFFYKPRKLLRLTLAYPQKHP